MLIRKALKEDSQALSFLMTVLGYLTTTAEMESRLDVLLQDRCCHTFVAECNGLLCGTIGVRVRNEVSWHKEQQFEAEVVVLVVSDSHRGTGVGSALLNAAENLCNSLKIDQMTISCGYRRIDTHRFYLRRGYQASVWITMPGSSERMGDPLAIIFKKRISPS
jgi:GNAT superfamily N-acetyltransferase